MDTQKMVDNILDAYNKADYYDRESGRDWYKLARNWCNAMAYQYNVEFNTVAAVLAALSPRANWKMNLKAADKVLSAWANGSLTDGFNAGVLGSNVDRARMILEAGVDTLRGPKITCFYKNIAEPDNVTVTVDTWAYKIALGDLNAPTSTFSETVYNQVADAYRQAAYNLGLPAHEVQAVTWVWARRVVASKVTAQQLPLF